MVTDKQAHEKRFNKEELIRAVFQYTYDITMELIEWIDSPMLAQTTLAQIAGAVEFVQSMVKEDATDAE